jgi:hypothetical protein
LIDIGPIHKNIDRKEKRKKKERKTKTKTRKKNKNNPRHVFDVIPKRTSALNRAMLQRRSFQKKK